MLVSTRDSWRLLTEFLTHPLTNEGRSGDDRCVIFTWPALQIKEVSPPLSNAAVKYAAVSLSATTRVCSLLYCSEGYSVNTALVEKLCTLQPLLIREEIFLNL